MAGHSKWANIQYRKGKQDAKRDKIFTKYIREISSAARMGGGDPDANPRLRLAILKAMKSNMPRDTIDRAVKRGAGGEDGVTMESIRYEGYGPGGVAVMVDCLTDNRTRTVGEVRHAFTKFGGNLGTDGSVSYLFNKQGLISFAKGSDENKIMEVALEAGADDVQVYEDGTIDVITQPEQFEAIRSAIKNAHLNPTQEEITLSASTEVALDQETAERLLKMVDMLEDLDDVQNVYTNADIAEEILEKMG